MAVPLDLGEVYDNALPVSPFSNSTDGDAWMHHWCNRCAYEHTCPLLTVALLGRTPAFWRERDRFSLTHRYTCALYTPQPDQEAQ